MKKHGNNYSKASTTYSQALQQKQTLRTCLKLAVKKLYLAVFQDFSKAKVEKKTVWLGCQRHTKAKIGFSFKL